ncbi:MAG: undecaprenyl-diphosphatase, partial [Campylobacter sp.]|nr:undecaprenyl-diphosphatase [Campylobacter sp.]
SGATIITGLLCGLNREVAARFSFLLAIPTMLAAATYDSYKNRDIFITNLDQIWIFLLGSAVAFIVALAIIKLFLHFVAKFSYISFGVYRIILGIVFLVFAPNVI